MPKTNKVKLTINIPAPHFEDTCGRGGYGQFCWETYGRYIDDGTDAQININIIDPKKK